MILKNRNNILCLFSQNFYLHTLKILEMNILENLQKSVKNYTVQLSSFQSLSPVRPLQPHRMQHTSSPCPSPNPKLAQTHDHRVSDDNLPSHPLSSPSPPSFNLSQHQGLFKWVSSSHQVAKVLGFQLQHQSFCKTQNSGLRSKEEKPRDPINQSSRCNTQEGLLTVVKTGWLWSPGRQSTPNSKLGKLFIDKKPYYQHITYGLQSDWFHVCKAILLVQTSRAFVQT